MYGVSRNPIKREVLCNHKEEGGIGLIDIFTKAKCIFLPTIIKMIVDIDQSKMIRYYLSNKINKYIRIDTVPTRQ